MRWGSSKKVVMQGRTCTKEPFPKTKAGAEKLGSRRSTNRVKNIKTGKICHWRSIPISAKFRSRSGRNKRGTVGSKGDTTREGTVPLGGKNVRSGPCCKKNTPP